MATGAELLFSNVSSFFQFIIGVQYFNTVLLFVLIFMVLHIIKKFIVSK